MIKVAYFSFILLLCGCATFDAYTAPSTEMQKRNLKGPQYAFSPKPNDRIIVFIHGILGDAFKTWQNQKGTYFWDLMKDDPENAYADFDIFVYGFPSHSFESSFTIDQAVADMDQQLRNAGVLNYREIILVAHSMGGLVAQRYLLTFRDIVQKVPLLFLFSTPQEGASITRLVRYVMKNPALVDMFPGGQNHYLRNLEAEWRQSQDEGFIDTRIKCAYETKDTFHVRIVDELSGTRLCRGVSSPVDADHIEIVKPKDRNSKSYVALKNAIQAIRPRSESTLKAEPKGKSFPSVFVFDAKTKQMLEDIDLSVLAGRQDPLLSMYVQEVRKAEPSYLESKDRGLWWDFYHIVQLRLILERLFMLYRIHWDIQITHDDIYPAATRFEGRS